MIILTGKKGDPRPRNPFFVLIGSAHCIEALLSNASSFRRYSQINYYANSRSFPHPTIQVPLVNN